MLFNTIDFLIFFPVVLLVYFVLPAKVRYIWLLASSYYFYMCWNPAYIILLLFSTLVTYVCGRTLEWIRERGGLHKKRWMKLALFIGFLINMMLGSKEFLETL